MKYPCVIVCIPTYRETEQVITYLRCCRLIQYRPLKIIIINASPGDKTSEIIAQERCYVDYEIIEVHGESSEFWSATVNRGLRKAIEIADLNDYVLISNIDIEFEEDIASLLVAKLLEDEKRQISVLCLSKGTALSSGVKVKSWITTSTYHPFSGMDESQIPVNCLEEVNYLPTRSLITPIAAIKEVGLAAHRCLPHYGADYEFSRRLAKAGYTPFIYTGARIEVDTKNTGKSVYSNSSSFLSRLLSLMSIRNPSNPWYRTILVLLVYPWYAWPTAILAYLLRTLIEVFFARERIASTFGKKGRGYS
jgi:GT2 family glycosyltransferase